VSPGSPDPLLVRRRLAFLDELLVELVRHQGLPLASLRSDLTRTLAVERALQLCAQVVVDLANHLLASAGLSSDDGQDAVRKLGRLGVLPAPFADRLAPVASFRNVLVHAYVEVDLAIVHERLNHGLEDFREFAVDVSAWLERKLP
jgi:uncharacterized protein YutE (UPF0331/DUF86 family)